MLALIANFFVFFALFLISYMIHEYCHIIGAALCGWTREGWHFQLPWAAGVKFEMNGHTDCLWIVSLWGLAGTALLGTLSLYSDTWIGTVLVVWNFTLLLFNAIPIKGTDGYWILKALLSK